MSLSCSCHVRRAFTPPLQNIQKKFKKAGKEAYLKCLSAVTLEKLEEYKKAEGFTPELATYLGGDQDDAYNFPVAAQLSLRGQTTTSPAEGLNAILLLKGPRKKHPYAALRVTHRSSTHPSRCSPEAHPTRMEDVVRLSKEHFDKHQKESRAHTLTLPPRMQEASADIRASAKQISQADIIVTEGTDNMKGRVPLLGDHLRFANVDLSKVGDT